MRGPSCRTARRPRTRLRRRGTTPASSASATRTTTSTGTCRSRPASSRTRSTTRCAQTPAQRRVERLLLEIGGRAREAARHGAARVPPDLLRHGGGVRRDEHGLRAVLPGRSGGADGGPRRGPDEVLRLRRPDAPRRPAPQRSHAGPGFPRLPRGRPRVRRRSSTRRSPARRRPSRSSTASTTSRRSSSTARPRSRS